MHDAKKKKKRREYVRACCTGGLSTIPALLLRNLSLSLWPDVYTLIDEVCEPSCCCCSDTSRCGRLHPAVTCLPTQRGSDLLLLHHHHHHHHPHQAWLFPVWLQEQTGNKAPQEQSTFRWCFVLVGDHILTSMGSPHVTSQRLQRGFKPSAPAYHPSKDHFKGAGLLLSVCYIASFLIF